MRSILLFVGLLLIGLPLSAQTTYINTVEFNGLRFQYPDSVGVTLLIEEKAGTEMVNDYVYSAVPPHTLFTFNEVNPAMQGWMVKQIRLYRTADFAEYPHYAQQAAALQTLLDEQPDLSLYQFQADGTRGNIALPNLPAYPTASAFTSRPTYRETNTLRGVQYLGIFLLEGDTFDNQYLFPYLYQALSKDGQYYVSAQFLVTAAVLPTREESRSAIPSTTYDDYLAQVEGLLNAAQPTDFSPNLTELDAIFASMEIGQ